MDIVGFGKIGCAVAKQLADRPQYNVFYIDTGLVGLNCYALPDSSSAEEAEEKTPNFLQLAKKVDERLFFFCSGHEISSGSILATLEQFKSLKINVVYIRPDLDLLSEKERLQEKVTFNVLQQYARSALFEKIVLIDDRRVANILGNLSIVEYRQKINSFIADSFHMVNYFKNSESIMSSISPPREINRICTIGIFCMETGKEKYFFDLDYLREKQFYFAFGEETLNKEKNLLNKISTQIKNAGQSEFTSVSYDITATTYEENFTYVEAYTNFIQGEKNS
jgi:hypothetical protein